MPKCYQDFLYAVDQNENIPYAICAALKAAISAPKEETEKIMVKRYGKPEEVAYLVRFLISDEANFINNSIIRIDGGQMGSC